MTEIQDRITNALQVLVGERWIRCSRAADMQCFGFGRLIDDVDRRGNPVKRPSLALHVQCPWRVADPDRILFAGDDLFRPADERIPWDQYSWKKHASVLDVAAREWFDALGEDRLEVVSATGGPHGGFRIVFEREIALEGFPCSSERGEYSERWRVFRTREKGSHFVVTGYGVEGGDDPAVPTGK